MKQLRRLKQRYSPNNVLRDNFNIAFHTAGRSRIRV